jgi:hypothetical protein
VEWIRLDGFQLCATLAWKSRSSFERANNCVRQKPVVSGASQNRS